MGHMGTHGAAPALYPNLKYDPAKDFEPIGMAAGTPIVIVAKKDFPAEGPQGVHRLREGAMRAKLNMAHAGVGSVSHTTGVLLSSVLEIKPTMVAYRGTGPALNDLMSGQVDFMTDQIVNVAPQISGGNIKAYAIATAGALAGPARRADHQGGRAAGLRGQRLERGLRAEGHAEGDPGEARRRARQGARRREHAQAPARARRRHPGQGPGAGPRRCRSSSRAEVARWTPVLKAAGAVGPVRQPTPSEHEARRAASPPLR